jgi:pimeloyl-ACP methyl ester carboxylesterase
MQTHDGHHLSVTTYGPDDAPLTVLPAHCWTLNQVLTVVPDAGHMLPLERDHLVSGVLIRLVRASL